jgi:hypothetical protein
MGQDKVLDLIESYLERHQPKDYRLNVSREGVRQDGNWWFVVVQPDRDDMNARDYSVIMSQTEDELEDREHLKVLLVPSLPGD